MHFEYWGQSTFATMQWRQLLNHYHWCSIWYEHFCFFIFFGHWTFWNVLQQRLSVERWRSSSSSRSLAVVGVAAAFDLMAFGQIKTWYDMLSPLKGSCDWDTMRSQVSFQTPSMVAPFIVECTVTVKVCRCSHPLPLLTKLEWSYRRSSRTREIAEETHATWEVHCRMHSEGPARCREPVPKLECKFEIATVASYCRLYH